ncbi:MAG TPA: hypothetical protein VEU62_23910, partial [Bryobacterales bacterium]|nr:hypothetical protein [Bryobacterales bacterium]
MAAKTARALLVVALLCVLLYFLRPLFACGPFFPEAVFTRRDAPDPPLDRFAGGELGVLQRTYGRPYLYAAYRTLIGKGFDASERQALLAYWGEVRGGRAEPDNPSAASAEWLRERRKAGGLGLPQPSQPWINVYRSMQSPFAYFRNCPDDAFRTAAATLDQRTARFGAQSPEVRAWLQGQDAVFSNCSAGHVIPAALGSGADPQLEADRAYQIAAAHFYAGDFDEAEKQFRAIAQDARSPWRRVAPYLAARTLLRKATLSKAEGADEFLLREAQDQLQRVLADPASRELHASAGGLLQFIRLRLDPQSRLEELSRSLLQQGAGPTLRHDLADYRFLLAHSSKLRLDDMGDWILAFEQPFPGSLDHCLEKWGETASAPWLVAALAQAPANHPRLPALLAAAAKIPPDSPAYLTAAYHVIRLEAASGKRDDARRRLDSLLSAANSLPPSAVNLFRAERMDLASTFDEFLRFAPRVPVAYGFGMDDNEEVPRDQMPDPLKAVADARALLDRDATKIFNKRLPLSLLARAVTAPALPAHLRRDLALAGWVRAELLDDQPVARTLATQLANELPELQPYLAAWLAAKDRPSRQFAAAFLTLKFPATRPYIDTGVPRLTPLGQVNDLRDNWWCRFDLGQGLDVPNRNKLWEKWMKDEPGGKPDPDAALPFPAFVTAAQQAAARAQWERIFAVGAAPNYLSRAVVGWAKTHPNDPRVPEALHLAVESTRIGCVDKETSQWSRAAFELLHQRYPKSPWAAQTKYW